MGIDTQSLVRRLIEDVWSKGDMRVIDEITERDVVIHDPTLQNGRGQEAFKSHVRSWRTAFPDMTCSIEETVNAGDRVSIRWRARGTHRGMLAGIAPTGRTATLTGAAVLRIANGKIAEVNAYYDQMELYQQLGTVPELDRLGQNKGTPAARP